MKLTSRKLEKKKIYYWSPFLSKIATCRSVINSAKALNDFGSKYESFILNFFGEFNTHNAEIKKKNINILNHYKINFSKYLPYKGKIKSRFSFLVFFFLGYFPLRNVIKKHQPEFLVIHLITSLPLILLILNNFNTKFILRISGYPRMNIIRKFLWKLAFKKIYLITCPTTNTLNYIKSLNIIENSKVKLLYDPIISIKEINEKKEKEIEFEDYYLSVGRLTKQKNFLFLCKGFKKIVEINKSSKLIIIGDGEDKSKLQSFIKKNNLEKNIILAGYRENIFPYFKRAKAFILPSLWEDPGFVLIEAAYCRTLVLSSNAWPGPVELVENEKNGIIFENNNMENFLNKFNSLVNFSNINFLKINNLKRCRNFTIFNHFKAFDKLLSNSF